MNKLILLVALVALAISSPAPTFAAESAAAKTAATKAKKPRPIPFHGNIGVLNLNANTIKLGKRVMQVTPDTKIVKNGAPATLKDAAIGDEVGGSYRKEGETLKLLSLRIGPKPPDAVKR